MKEIQTRSELENISAPERLIWALTKFKLERITATTSGGETSAILLSLLVNIHRSLKLQSPFRVVFVDPGLYSQSTYDFIEMLQKLAQHGEYQILTYKPTDSLESLTTTNPNWSEFGSPDFKVAQYLLKKKPLEQAFTDLGTDLWINGLMRHESQSRAQVPIFEQRPDGLCVLHPIADWSALQVERCISANHLPTNLKHSDFFKGPNNGECGIHL